VAAVFSVLLMFTIELLTLFHAWLLEPTGRLPDRC